MTRTFGKADWNASQTAWAEGEFSPEWRDVRDRAAMRGMIYPPNGTRFDCWEDDQPTQRAILIRAIRETPELLDGCIDRSRSWDDVIRSLITIRDEWRAAQKLRAPTPSKSRPRPRLAEPVRLDALLAELSFVRDDQRRAVAA